MPDHDDFWGADFHPNNAESKPVTLLKKQADLLGPKTDNRVQGVVKQYVSPDGTIWTSLYAGPQPQELRTQADIDRLSNYIKRSGTHIPIDRRESELWRHSPNW